MGNGIGLFEAPPALTSGPGLYRALVDSLDECVFLLDPDGRHVAANATFCRWLGRAEDEIVGRTAFDLWPAALAQRLAADTRRVLTGERLEREEQLPRGLQGRSVRLLQAPVRDEPDGPIHAVLGMFRDVTEERAREEQMRQTGPEGMGRLAASLAHDLNNLLTVFQVNIPLVREALPPASPHLELVTMLEKTARLAAELTGQLLNFARHQALRLQPVNLNAVLGDVITLLGRAIDPRVRLEIRRRPGLASVLADPTQMAQVVLNLCLNACDAMPAGGRLTLETEEVHLGVMQAASHPEGRPGSFVRLRVCDTGEGMTEEVRSRVFEPFFTTKRPGKGTGLGLSIVRDAAQQADGWVECSSVPGAGSSFTLYLPGIPVACAVVAPMPPVRQPDDTPLPYVPRSPDALCRNRTFLGMGRATLAEGGSRQDGGTKRGERDMSSSEEESGN